MIRESRWVSGTGHRSNDDVTAKIWMRSDHHAGFPDTSKGTRPTRLLSGTSHGFTHLQRDRDRTMPGKTVYDVCLADFTDGLRQETRLTIADPEPPSISHFGSSVSHYAPCSGDHAFRPQSHRSSQLDRLLSIYAAMKRQVGSPHTAHPIRGGTVEKQGVVR